MASSWGRPSEPPVNEAPGEKRQQYSQKDWFSRWESQKVSSFEELAKHIERDPYRALFGRSNSLLGWLDGRSAISRSAGTSQAESGARSVRPQPEKVQQRPFWPKTWTYVRTSTVDTQEYDIDPITLRKVPKQRPMTSSCTNASRNAENETVSIPVKKSRQTASTNRNETKIPSAQAEISANQKTHQDWLVHEGFREKEQDPNSLRGNLAKAETRHQPSRIESALDRQVRIDGPEQCHKSNVKVEYNPKENKEDDVDLLRASDVRASAGSGSRMTKEDPSVKAARQRALAESYEKRPSELNSMLAAEMACKQLRQPLNDAAVNSDRDSKPTTTADTSKTSPRGKAVLTSSQVGVIRAKLVPLKTKIDVLSEDYAALRRQLLVEKRRIEEASKKKAARRACEMLDQEVKSQQDAMKAIELRDSRSSEETKVSPKVPHEELHGEGDMASNVHEFAGRARWYKRKAPHAQCEMDAKLDRLAKEKTFVGQIREIYEDTYGPISTFHRQPPPNTGGKSLNKSSVGDFGEAQVSSVVTQHPFPDAHSGVTDSPTPNVPSMPEQASLVPKTVYYRILAYDSASQKVNSATTSSQTPFAGEKPLTPLQALNGLQNPGKFLPHLMVLHNKGYDIISGAKNTLILKKVRDGIASKEDYFGRPNPIDGTTTPEVSAGNFASPTGFVNHNPIIPPEEREPQRSQHPRSTDRVQREEEVFSASRRSWQEGKRTTKKDKGKVKRGKMLKHMLLAGTFTAAACYSAGVIFEMMSV